MQNGHVVELDLNNNGLKGAVPDEYGQLTALVKLLLYGNSGITGWFAAVPESISKLVNLQKLWLGETGISSAFNFVIERRSTPESCLFVAVPESISALVNLTVLDLSHTGISSALGFVIERHHIN